MTEIKDALLDFNPWWKGPFHLDYKERELYAKLQKYLPLPQILAFTGLRRVGKTTILYKIIQDFTEKGTNPRKILYFSFDDFKEAELRMVLQAAEELTEVKPQLIIFDEIQKVPGWEGQLKVLYDLLGKKTKILISGSESLFIKKKLKETLAGRIFEFKVELLTFKEFLNFQGLTFHPSSLYEKELAKAFQEYIQSMGFPELLSITDKEIIKKYIQEGIIDKIIYKDIPALFKVKDVSVLQSLLNVFMHEPGQIIELSALATQFHLSRQTISNYLVYLEESFLLQKLYNFSNNRRKVERKLKKYYPAVIAVDLLFKEDDLSRSHVFEWLLVTQKKADFFWRDNYQHEVDMVLGGEKIFPVEIKYGKISFQGLLPFLKKFKLKEGWIISSSQQEEKEIDGKKFHIIPAWKWLLQT
ncbi:TPA: ATP-binding protein [Candidatus Woesearchaeota archaeon]|nr:ATP-binding protein [Candidatus Woesearchaeota archaeon]